MKAELLQLKKDGANVHVAYVIYEGITLPSKLIITKIKNGEMPPSVSPEELKKLNIL